MSRPKILLLADTPDWAFARECDALVKHLGHAYEFCRAYFQDKKFANPGLYKPLKEINLSGYDLILIKGFLWFPYEVLSEIPPEKIIASANSFHIFDRDDLSEMFFPERFKD